MQRSAPRVVKNTLAQFAARGLEGATNFALTILLARILGARQLGTFAFLTTYAGFFLFLGTLGLNLLMAREVARQREQARRYLANALGMGFMLALLTFVLQVGLIRVISPDPTTLRGAYYAAVFTVFHSWEWLFVGTFYGLERMELETLGILVEKALVLAAVFALVLTGANVITVLAVLAAAKGGLSLVYLAISTRLVGFPRPHFELSLWRRLAGLGWPFALNLLLVQVNFQVHVLLVKVLAGDACAGYFRAGSIIALSLPMLAAGLNNAMLPLMARAHPRSRESFQLGLDHSLSALNLVALPTAAGLAILARPLVNAIFGPRFAPAIPAFQLLALTVPLKFAIATVGTALTAADRQPQRALALSIAAATNIGLAVLLIPRLAHVGAALAALAADIILLLIVCQQLRRAEYPVHLIRLAARPALAAAVMGVALWALRGASLALSIPAGVIVFAAVAVAVGAITRSQVEWLTSALRENAASASDSR